MKKMIYEFVRLAAVAGAVMVCSLSDAVELASPFADGIVLQRGRKVPVWGSTKAAEKVTVAFAGQEVSAIAGADGRWRVDLPAMEASKEGRELTVYTSSDSKKIADVLVGEVWYVSGQSNAECPLWNNSKDGNNPRFRDRNGALIAQMTFKPFVRMCYASNYRTSDTPRANAAYPVK